MRYTLALTPAILLGLAQPACASISICGTAILNSVGIPCSVPVVQPTGRISDNSTSCAHQTDSSTITTLYYLPCAGSMLPISNDGSTFSIYSIPSTSTTLSTASTGNFPANTLFDFYAFNSAGSVTYCAVKWGTSTSGASTRGASASITTLNGIVVNNGAWTCFNGATSYTLTGSEATLLGTFLISSTAQDIAVSFTPAAATSGAACVVGYANLYNTQIAQCMTKDSNTSWTYAATAFQELDASTTNIAKWVDPIGISSYSSELVCPVSTATSGDNQMIGIGINSTSVSNGSIGLSSLTSKMDAVAQANGIAPQASGGLNYAAALQAAFSTAVTATYYGASTTNVLQAESLTLTVPY